jgi:flagellar biosynthesis/type III secretory pathway protein FliH
VAPIHYPTVEEVEAIRHDAYEEAYELGSNEGFVEGRTAGYDEGKTTGYDEGYKAGYQDAEQETLRLQNALGQLLEAVSGMPEAIAEPLTQFSFEIASRLSANISMERAPFVMAVQEALMRLPRPGENLYLRLRSEEVDTWRKIVEDPGLPFNCTILVDADVRPGHAYVEVSGARIDVGVEARMALVRTALGLDSSVAQDDKVVDQKITPKLLEDESIGEAQSTDASHAEEDHDFAEDASSDSEMDVETDSEIEPDNDLPINPDDQVQPE